MKRVRYQRELVRVQQARFFTLATAPAAGKIHLRVEELHYFGGILFDPPATNPSFVSVCFYFFFSSSFYFLTDDPRILVDHRQRFSVSRCKKKRNARGRETAAPLRRDSR